jgi:hypothetical protein
MHIAFLTLFLGLTSGIQPFELSVGGPVASIEILLDGAVAQRLNGPPWKGEIDLGSDLAPHDLVARALDASGKEVARTRQWINLPRPPAEVEIALESPRTARLSWERLTHEPPVQTSLTLDGQELQLDAERRANLPAYDPDSTHVLTAELRFPSNVVARKDLVFGGVEGETHTELTAVPVEVLKGRLPADLQGWFANEDGTPLEVAAVEEGPGELYLVRAPGPDAVRTQIGGMLGGKFGRHLPLPGSADLIRVVSPWARAYQGEGTRSDLFDLSPRFPGPKGLGSHLVEGFFRPDPSARLRFADATAVAGLHAMAGGRRRIVVLVVDSRSQDGSRYDPITVRRYLSSIRVPLVVWTVNRNTSGLEDWGEMQHAFTPELISRAFRKAATVLERQRIIWIEGRHLPQSIRLSPQARGIAIAGVADVPPAPPRRERPAIDLLTAFPSLVAGDQPLQVGTRGAVSAVELQLDGKSLGRVSGPLWNGSLALGADLVPHELVARALGPQGEDLDRVRQWINLPAIEVGLALEDGAIRVSWTFAEHEPREVAVAFDGKPLEVKDGRAVLPAYDPGRVHLIAAKLTFPREIEVRQAAALRDGPDGRTLRELTPLPVRLQWGARLPPLEELQGKLTARGEPLRVVAAESGRSELFVVRVPAREETRTLLAPLLEKQESDDDILLSLQSLGQDHWLRLVSTRPTESPAGAPRLGLFNLLPALQRQGRALLFHLTDWDFNDEDPLLEVRAADAVAVAGLQAAAAGHRRAVLLVLGGPFEDRSRLKPAAVRAYLSSLGVPLYVWPLKDPFPAWEGESFDKGLKVDLDLQRILWVEGRHLAREVRLAPEVTGLELLAR